ncbi:MAG: ribose-phosphate pyrophosphokinase-like domain-containing protein [Gelidibacter sp.]
MKKLTELLAKKMDAEIGKATLRKFPDGESYTRILSDVKDKCVVLVCTLHEPDKKLLHLFFKPHGQIIRSNVHNLIAPYLAYMRQDKIFNAGEGVTSTVSSEETDFRFCR